MDLKCPGIAPNAPQICNTEAPVYGVVATRCTLCSITIACSVLVHFNAVCVFFVCIRHRVYIINKSIIRPRVRLEKKTRFVNGPQR